MSSSRKKLFFNTVSVDLGCGSCRKPRISLSHILYPKTKPRKPTNQKPPLHNYCSSSSWDNDTTTSIFSPYGSSSQFSSCDNTARAPKTVRGLGRVGGQGVAVEKDSDDPYLDFRHSMLQMILENEIYAADDLRKLLQCFLLLNSPHHHGVIVRAFTEIWNGVHSVKPSSPKLCLSRKSRWLLYLNICN
ncbi:transcription repressor OFP6-like [Prosopis cineraria]|uniref:transcription repressor OFP6-like n=1 Tax=Prosopis cineraria TaxID=364024 RepID=UPI00240F2258|nr:transcription repressor OFP6-like [Prosopis cineraria]